MTQRVGLPGGKFASLLLDSWLFFDMVVQQELDLYI